MSDRMDYQALLRKYIEWVGNCEGVTFIGSGGWHDNEAEHFTPEQWEELRRIDAELDAERARQHAAWLATRKP